MILTGSRIRRWSAVSVCARDSIVCREMERLHIHAHLHESLQNKKRKKSKNPFEADNWRNGEFMKDILFPFSKTIAIVFSDTDKNTYVIQRLI